MAAKTLAFEPLRTLIKKRSFSPVYILHGEEGYFIDALLKDFSDVLTPDEKDFNMTVLYAPRTDLSRVPEICRRMPMMAEYQIVILKEAQAARANDLNLLAKYIASPSPSTIFIIASRGDTLKGESLKAAKKNDNAVIFESKAIRDYELPKHIQSYINSRGVNVQPKALGMLGEYVGTDLSRLYNEIDKLIDILGPGASVTPEAIEKHIGFSKTYNAYELVDALAVREAKKVFRIAGYFRANPKAVPLVLVNATLFSFFSDLLITYFVKDKTDRGIMTALGIKWPVQFKKFANARTRYNASQVIEIVRAIRAFDRMSKGGGSRRNEYDLFQELMYRILTARGNLFPKF